MSKAALNVHFVRSVYYSDTLELIKYFYLAIKVSSYAFRNIYKIRNLYLIRIIPYFDERYT